MPRSMPKSTFILLIALAVCGLAAVSSPSLGAERADHNPDVLAIPPDLENPAISASEPAPGKMTLQSLPAYAGTEVAHTLYLPTDWAPGKRFPVLIEYYGNGRRVRDGGGLGYGISGGKGFIWAVLPYVSPDHRTDMERWWGDVEATVAYAREAVPAICRQWGGDPSRVILVGHSRGAIACNYIGLHDGEIARLWRAMIPVSHYDDGHVRWGMTPAEQARAAERLGRLGAIPQLICGEHHLQRNHNDKKLWDLIKAGNFSSFAKAKEKLGLAPMVDAEGTRRFIAANAPRARCAFVDLPYVNHTPDYVLRDIPERRRLRAWVQEALRDAPLIIDNEDASFSQRGFKPVAAADAHGREALTNPGTAKAPCFARYEPGLSGAYDVYLYWGAFPDMDADVNWTVRHARGVTLQPFNQRNNPGWHFHGSYQFDLQSYVELSIPAGRRRDAPVVADAVKFVPTVPRVVERAAKDTLTPVTLNYGDELRFKLRDGQVRSVKLLSTGAAKGKPYRFWATLSIDGKEHRIERVIPAQASFYEPLEIHGLRLWLDAVSDIFTDDGGFMIEKDIAGAIACRPPRKARIAVNDVHDRICPEPLVFWYPEKKDFIDASKCYNGEDVWMGPYEGRKAHGGLDINMTSGTLLFAPIRFDDQYLFDSLAAGDNNNRWRAIRRWDSGAVWWLQSHHLNRLLIDERQPLARGACYAETAGVHAGSHQHTHFVFRVFEEGESYFLDPWILFWQMFRDRR